MSWFGAIAVIIAMGLEAFFVHQYDVYKYEAAWNKFQAQSIQAVSDAQSEARARQAKEIHDIQLQSQAAVAGYKVVADKAVQSLADFKSHTKAVSNVPEVKAWLDTRIPADLLNGVCGNPGSGCGHNPGSGAVPPNPSPSHH